MSKAEELVKATQEMPELESQATSVVRALVLLTNAQERTLSPSEPSSWTILGLILGSVPEKQVSGWRTLASVTTKFSAHSENL